MLGRSVSKQRVALIPPYQSAKSSVFLTKDTKMAMKISFLTFFWDDETNGAGSVQKSTPESTKNNRLFVCFMPFLLRYQTAPL